MSSLDRLIRLAQRTGDRLIVHDPVEGQDIVLLDIASYERLLGEEGKADWPTVADFSEEDEESPWQSAGDIIEERYGAAEPQSGGVSFVEEMWGPMHDARTERAEGSGEPVPQEASDEPVFYEEPLG